MLRSSVERSKLFLSECHIQVSDEWISDCVQFLFNQPSIKRELADGCIERRVYEQWLAFDLDDTGVVGSLPVIDETQRYCAFNGSFVVQLQSIRDCGCSALSQYHRVTKTDNENIGATDTPDESKPWEPKPKRLLMLEVTDGSGRVVKAVEHRPLTKLSESTCPGSKLLFHGTIVCRRGILFLEDSNTTLLGGFVTELAEKFTSRRLLKRILNKASPSMDNSVDYDSPAPPSIGPSNVADRQNQDAPGSRGRDAISSPPRYQPYPPPVAQPSRPQGATYSRPAAVGNSVRSPIVHSIGPSTSAAIAATGIGALDDRGRTMAHRQRTLSTSPAAASTSTNRLLERPGVRLPISPRNLTTGPAVIGARTMAERRQRLTASPTGAPSNHPSQIAFSRLPIASQNCRDIYDGGGYDEMKYETDCRSNDYDSDDGDSERRQNSSALPPLPIKREVVDGVVSTDFSPLRLSDSEQTRCAFGDDDDGVMIEEHSPLWPQSRNGMHAASSEDDVIDFDEDEKAASSNDGYQRVPHTAASPISHHSQFPAHDSPESNVRGGGIALYDPSVDIASILSSMGEASTLESTLRTLRCFVMTITRRLSNGGGSAWSLAAMLNDGSACVAAEFDDRLLNQLIGYSANDAQDIIARGNSQSRAEASERVKSFQTFLQRLDLLFKIEFQPRASNRHHVVKSVIVMADV